MAPTRIAWAQSNRLHLGTGRNQGFTTLAQANQSLGDLTDRQCDVLAASFKSDCRVVLLTMSASLNDRRAQQFNNDFAGSQRLVNANLNATFELTARGETPPAK